MRLCELENKEVINACDCKKLGYVVDLIIDECKGCIEALVIPRAENYAASSAMGRNILSHTNASGRLDRI